jgi:hypothetical protein
VLLARHFFVERGCGEAGVPARLDGRDTHPSTLVL